MHGSEVRAVEMLLKGLPGVREACELSAEARGRVLEVEEEYERSGLLSVCNLGIREAVRRQRTFVLLKDGTFRQPGVPTVYMVEECDACPEGPRLSVAGRTYRIIGEEVLPSRPLPAEHHIPVSDGFVLYPDRRSGGDVPCRFVVPPLGFEELESRSEELGISDIVSVSPSLAVDEYLRRELGFPPTNLLATILIGFEVRGNRHHVA